ncbi:MAG: uracil-DNA glycosylase family protein [Gemmatimonadota bacterium]
METLWVGAAPGNAGGRGGGAMGAHATRIPFGGDVAGANLDVLLGTAGLDRNQVFITAALNQLPAAGGGEPKPAELRAGVGTVPSSIHLLRETVLASGAALVLALGNVALRATVAAGVLDGAERVLLPGKARLEGLGFARGEVTPWGRAAPPDAAFTAAWRTAWGQAALPAILWLTHPSAQNMSPWARRQTLFHLRMLEARDAVRGAVREVLGREPPAERPRLPATGIYALPAWRTQIGPRHAELDARWRDQGV